VDKGNERTVMKPEAKKLHNRGPQLTEGGIGSGKVSSSSSIGSVNVLDRVSSVLIGLYSCRRRNVGSVAGGNRWRTEINCAVAVPEGKASFSFIIWLQRWKHVQVYK
jgi:hypothetical protein